MLRLLTIIVAASLAGCAAMPAHQELEGDDPYKNGHLELSRPGRYTPSAAAKAAGEAQTGTYESAGAYNGGRGCSGTFTAGAQTLGAHIVTNFGATRYDGYSCRPNSANRSELSMHGTGRAIDLYVPLDGGQADNDVGDAIANWLIENATDIGVQFFIWDRTKWNISYSGVKDRAYGGPHPHHDHLHVELSRDGAAMETAWFGRFGGGTPGDSPADEPTPTGTVEPAPATGSGCTDTCPYFGDGECDDGGPGAVYSLCDLGTDCSDCGSRAAGGSSPTPTPTPTPAPAPEPAPDAGACTDTCRYAGDGECDDGGAGAAYSVCALGTDCTDCGPRAGTSGPTPTPGGGGGTGASVPHAGLDLDGMSIPRAGLRNPTLERTLGVATEPHGRVESHSGVNWVRGSISWFGGPTDTGVSSTETGAVTGERLRSLNSPMNPSASEAARRPADYYFAAMRWNYSPRGVSWLRTARLVVRNPTTGATIVVRPVDWGPHSRTNRVIDLSHEALRALGLSTDDDVLIAWAPQSSALGPVR